MSRQLDLFIDHRPTYQEYYAEFYRTAKARYDKQSRSFQDSKATPKISINPKNYRYEQQNTMVRSTTERR